MVPAHRGDPAEGGDDAGSTELPGFQIRTAAFVQIQWRNQRSADTSDSELALPKTTAHGETCFSTVPATCTLLR